MRRARWLVIAMMAALGLSLALPPAPARAAEEVDPLDPATASAPVRRAVFRAETTHGRGETAEAVRILREALEAGEGRDHPSLLYRLGAYLLELDEAGPAADYLAQAGAKAPDSPPIWADLARATYQLGRYDEAARAFARAHVAMQTAHRAAPEETPAADPVLLYYSGVAHLLGDEPDEAVDTLAPLVASAPDTVPREWVQALVSAAADAGQPARAAAGVERLLRDHPDAPGAWNLASQHAQLENDLAGAALRLQVADWLRPLPPQELRLLGDLYGAAELPRQAARAYQRLWPDDPDLARPLAVAWLQAHEPDSARVVLDAAIADPPDDRAAVQMLMLLGDLEYGEKNWQAAREAYRRAAERDPDSGRAWLMQGATSIELEDVDAARRALERAAEFDAQEAEAERLLEYLERGAS
ncbi:tetratricopeptide repeat protein [bacterium]|nr:tetratricopeptide repeat protein [bacterium]